MPKEYDSFPVTDLKEIEMCGLHEKEFKIV